MVKSRSIFERQRLNPQQLRTVAERRFDDATYLQKSRLGKHANGAMYLAGFVIECLLKANLLMEHGWLQSAGSPLDRTEDERDLWFLCHRWHDLGGMLERLPKLTEKLTVAGQHGQSRVLQSLKQICALWTISARYSTKMATMQEADDFVGKVQEVRQWLK